jgi:hypothetical protein
MLSRTSVYKIVGSDYHQVRIGQEIEGESGLLRKGTRGLWCIHADGYYSNAGLLQFLLMSLDSP